MQYSQFKDNFINKIFVPYMNGQKGEARTELANVYRTHGNANPRAVMFQTTSALKETNKIYNRAVNEMKKSGQNESINVLMKNYISFASEISGGKHPVVENAIQNVKSSLMTMYPKAKTRQFTKFILTKQTLPILGKMKFLARFF